MKSFRSSFKFLSDFSLQAQLRPSTGTYDQKESLWLQRKSLWPSDEDVPNFKQSTSEFMTKCAAISDQICKCTIKDHVQRVKHDLV